MVKHVFSFLKKIAFISLALIFTILMLYMPAFAAAKGGLTKNIEIETKDKVLLEGIIELPKSATAKHKVPLVIMLHSLGSRKEVYNSFVEDLRSRGIASVRFDLRGHGESIGNSVNNRKTYWQQYSNKTFQKYPDDIITVLDFIKDNFQQVDTNKTAIIAADISANSSILAANNKIKTLVLLSPCIDFKGIKTSVKLVDYGNHPILFIVSKKDKFGYYQSSELIKYAQGKKVLKVLDFGGMGDRIIKLNPSAKVVILQWIDENFKGYVNK